MKTILVRWLQGEINGSRYTIHPTDSYSSRDVFWAIDELDCPSGAISVRVSSSDLEFLSDHQLEFLDDGGVIDDVTIEDKLSELWIEIRSRGKSKYAKIKHPRWGLVDEHRGIMQDYLGKRLARNVVVHHKNENKYDNRLENLEVMSLSEHTRMHCKIGNWHDRFKGKENRFPKGSLSRSAGFTYVEAYAIREMFKNTQESGRAFARSLGIRPCTMSKMLREDSYV